MTVGRKGAEKFDVTNRGSLRLRVFASEFITPDAAGQLSELQQDACGIFQQLLDGDQELHGFAAIDDTVVIR